MFVKLTVLACVAVVAFGQHWNGGNQGGWNGGGNQNALDAGEYVGDGDYHGEGLQEAGAFGDVSQNWQDNNGQWNGDNGQQWNQGNQGNQGGWNGGQQQGGWNGGQQHGGWNGGQQQGGWNGGQQQGAWNGGQQQGAWNGGQHGGQALLPAGVDASACPNYPYCH